MNNICKNCDTRNRMCLCDGRDGNFKYCFRKVGSSSGLEETITQFNTLHELYEKCGWLNWIVPKTLILDNKMYGCEDNMVLLWGQSLSQLNTNQGQPVGYVTVETTVGMKQIYYIEENSDE